MTVSSGKPSSPVPAAVTVAVETIQHRWRIFPRVAIVLGTGLGRLTDALDNLQAISYVDLPGFPQSTAVGHHGRLVGGLLRGVPVVVFDGRCHLYEGYSAEQVTLPVTVSRALGAELLVVSNASGGLNPQFRRGDIMAMADHINLLGVRTRGLSDFAMIPSRSARGSPYDPSLIALAQECARESGFACHVGTYASVLGPNYETRAEYRALRLLGGDAVGMSTVPEVLAAARCGMRVLALSTITNVARPDALAVTAGQDVADTAALAEPRLRAIVCGVLERTFPIARGS